MTIEELSIIDPSIGDIYEWHKEEASKALSLYAPLAWPAGIVHLTGATLLWFPGVNQVIYTISKQCFLKKGSESSIVNRSVNHLFISPQERERLNNLESTLRERVIGQDTVIQKVCNAIRTSILNLNQRRPRGVFLFLGPTGVGKTELAKAIGENWLDKNNVMHQFDMSEYKDIFHINNLIGAPPGLIGYDDGGSLTKALQKNPKTVILFEEIEKAHPEVLDILLQIFDQGRITTANGTILDCSQALFIMTSNLGANVFSSSKKEQEDVLDKELRKHLRPEFINRIGEILYFNPIDNEEIFRKIVLSKIYKFKSEMDRRLCYSVTISWSEDVIDFFIKKGFSPTYGIRPLERLIQRTLHTLTTHALLNDEIVHEGQMIFKVQDDQIILEHVNSTC